MAEHTNEDFEALLGFLKESRGFDFTGYKRASLVRRVQRRMLTTGASTFEEYHDYLVLHPEEFAPLFNTILINVTSFFRDHDAWSHLRNELVPDLLSHRDGLPLRAWSAGCASGEEAYTLAMILAEELGIEEFRERVKIYATDVDDDALATARQATYGEKEIQGVPSDLREKYFERLGDRFAAIKDLRRSVIFGRNDLVQDAPISHVDILTCRNTLMYFNAQTQAEILQRMHFALRPDGILFLGKAEMLLSHSGMFRPLELKRRFFQKVVPDGADRKTLPLSSQRVEDEDAAARSRLRQAALMSSASAQLVLDGENNLAMSNSRANYLFGLTPRDIGRPLHDLEVSYRPTELRGHLIEAMRERRPQWIRDITWLRGVNEELSLDVQIVPLADETGNVLGTTVIFNDVTRYRQLQQELEYSNRQLETAYEELQSTNEELETTNEELQSTVEELETTNEELQSTNEELETMNEELQSMNDELQLSNGALRDRQEEVDRLNRFMSSVLGSMRAGVAVVDGDLRVLSWNATAAELWGIRSDEAVGEHLLGLDIGLPLEAVRPLIKSQLSDEESDYEAGLRLAAVNRRGRPIEVQVTVTRLDREGPVGAIIMMDVLDPAESRAPASTPD